jgi:hypothetical protein
MATRRFPRAEFAIRRLMNLSEAFCDMCEELADAEALLFGAQDTHELAKLANPIASLISVPFQFNYDDGYGPNDGGKTYGPDGFGVRTAITFQMRGTPCRQ